MNKAQKEKLKNELYEYLLARHGASREEVDRAIEKLGLVKGRLETYFLVRSYESRKQSVIIRAQ